MHSTYQKDIRRIKNEGVLTLVVNERYRDAARDGRVVVCEKKRRKQKTDPHGRAPRTQPTTGQSVTILVCCVPAFRLTPNQLLHQQKRYRGKINIQKPKAPHYVRQLVDRFLTPHYENPVKHKTLAELCKRVAVRKERQIGPYEVIIAREFRNWMEHSKMVAVLHRNWLHSEHQLDLQIALKAENMYFKIFSRRIIEEGLRDSPYTGIESLAMSPIGFIFCPDLKVPVLLKILKDFPQVLLIAGYLEGQLFNREKFLQYGKLDLVSAQADLVSTLQKAGGNNLYRQLTHHQITLTNVLKQMSDQMTATPTTTPDDEKE